MAGRRSRARHLEPSYQVDLQYVAEVAAETVAIFGADRCICAQIFRPRMCGSRGPGCNDWVTSAVLRGPTLPRFFRQRRKGSPRDHYCVVPSPADQ
jgi:hypothetical protein